VATQTFHVFGVLIMYESAQLILHSKATITMYLKFVSDTHMHPVHVDEMTHVINYVPAFMVII
jgi:hypothetical protein